MEKKYITSDSIHLRKAFVEMLKEKGIKFGGDLTANNFILLYNGVTAIQKINNRVWSVNHLQFKDVANGNIQELKLETAWNEAVEYFTKPVFKVGDIVVDINGVFIGKINNIDNNVIHVTVGDITYSCNQINLRHATKEEIEEYNSKQWKENLKEGDWVWYDSGNLKTAARCTNCYHNNYDALLSNVKVNEYYRRLATAEEITATLKAVAEKKGFKEGVKVKSLQGLEHILIDKYIVKDNNLYIYSNAISNAEIYNNTTDTWAEIIPSQIYDVVHAENANYNVEIVKEGILHNQDSIIIPIEYWKGLIKNLETNSYVVRGFDKYICTCRTIKTIDIGCAKGIKHEELLRIYNIWKSNFDK